MYKDKVVLVFGGSSGIGWRVATKFAELGCKVYNGSRTPCIDSRVINLLTDVTSEKDIDTAFGVIEEREGRVDTMVYSAGFSMAAPFEYTKSEDYRYLFEVNFFGLVKSVQKVIPLMRTTGGRIFLISSMGGILPIPFDPFYSASKAAVNMLVEELDIELTNIPIEICSILPGGTRTPFTSKRKIYNFETVGDYSENMDAAVDCLARIEQGGMSADSVAKSIVKLAFCNKLPVLSATGFSNKVYRIVGKVMPKCVIAKMVKEKYEIK